MYQSVPLLTGNPDLFVICLHYHLLLFSSIFQEVLKGEHVDEKVKNTLTFLFINLCFLQADLRIILHNLLVHILTEFTGHQDSTEID